MLKQNAITPELMVSDFQKSLDFYVRLAGFKVLYDRPAENFAMLGINGSRLMIEEINENRRVWKTGEFEHPFGRGINFQIEVLDVQELYTNFKNHEYPIFFDMEEKWYERNDGEIGHKQFLVQDPDGYLLRFFQDLGTREFKK